MEKTKVNWIKIKDAFPEEHETILIYLPEAETFYRANYQEGVFRYIDDGGYIVKIYADSGVVSHWAHDLEFPVEER